MKRKGIILLLSLIFLLSGCLGTPDYVPDVLGEWEGNYIYYNFYRMKTTGGKHENLLKDFEIDGRVWDYAVIDGVRYEDSLVTQTYYNDDDIYMCVFFGDEQNVLIKYNLLTKTFSEVYRGQPGNFARGIYIFRNELIILSGGGYSDSNLFIIDHEGNIIQSHANEYSDYKYFDEYIVNVVAGKVEYRLWGDAVFKTMVADGSISKDNTFVVFIDGKFYLTVQELYRLERDGKYVGADYLRTMFVFDIQSGVAKKIFESTANRSVTRISKDYFIAFDVVEARYETYSWTENGSKHGSNVPPKGKRYTIEYIYTATRTNCVLYRINNDLSVTEVFKFDKDNSDKDFAYSAHIVDDKFINFQAKWIVKNGHNYGSYNLNLATFKLSKGQQTSSQKNEPELYSKRVFGDFYYYPSESNNYIYLHRKNLQTGVAEIVQYASRYENKKELFGYDWFDYGDIQAIRDY